MLEAMLIGFCLWGTAWVIYVAFDSWPGLEALRGYQPPPELKWAVNPRAMRWLIPIIVVGITAYVLYLKYLGLI